MDKVRLGKTGLTVSRIGMGGIPIQRLVEEEAVAVVKKCLELGINFFDTANAYTTSEGVIGKAIADWPAEVVLATKSTARDRERLERHLAQSLERLGVDSIDLYQVHGVDDFDTLHRLGRPGGVLTALEEAKGKGRIKHIGISSHVPDVAREAVASGRFETLMFTFNFVAGEAASEVVPLCQERGVGFIAMKPMAGGRLENASLAMKFLLQFPRVVPVVGVESTAQVEELVGIVEGDLSLSGEEQRQMLLIGEELGSRFCRRCEYCQPCPEGIQISDVMLLPTYVKCFPLKMVVSGWVAEVIRKAETCTGCGECEERCPFNLPIREMLREHVALFHRCSS